MPDTLAQPPLFRILTPDAWRAAQAAGVFTGTTLDDQDGFIHLSSAGQVAGTLAAHFAGQAELVLLSIDADRLPTDALHWEPSRDNQLFPHLYAELPLDAVTRVDVLRQVDGKHSLPKHLSGSTTA